MKISAVAALAALASSVSGAAVQSHLFHLVLDSSNPNWNGRKLSACHEGAAIESLCIGDFKTNPESSYFRLKKDAKGDEYGHLTWLESKATHYVQSLGFYNNSDNNVALPMFGLGKVKNFNFDSEGDLNVNPAGLKDSSGGSKRWYMCRQTFESYDYNVLSFVVGTGKPDIESCQKVNVKRTFKKS